MYIDKETLKFNAFTNSVNEQHLTIRNLNSMALTRLEWIFIKNDLFNMTIKTTSESNSSSIQCVERCVITDSFEKNTTIYITFSLISDKEILGLESKIAFITAEKVYTTLSLSINVSKRRPVFSSVPENGFDFRLLNKQKLFFQFDLTNTGSLKANNITIKMPQTFPNIQLNIIDIVNLNESQKNNWVIIKI